MKALVVSNCNGQAHHKFLTHFFPDWDVRLVLVSQADQWVAESHAGFVGFLRELDLCIGALNFLLNLPDGMLNPAATAIHVPGYVYTGTRPDCFWFPEVRSPTGGGILHSKIGVSAYCAGKSVEDATALFNAGHFERLGYFDEHRISYEAGRQAFEPLGVDFAALFRTWWESGDFMYTPNHPSGAVLFDLLRQILETRGLLDGIAKSDLDSTRGTLDDALGRGILWPVYPEIAERLKVINPITHWRGSKALGQGSVFTLPEMLLRSYATYDDIPDIRDRAAKALGAENLAVYAGEAAPDRRIVQTG